MQRSASVCLSVRPSVCLSHRLTAACDWFAAECSADRRYQLTAAGAGTL